MSDSDDTFVNTSQSNSSDISFQRYCHLNPKGIMETIQSVDTWKIVQFSSLLDSSQTDHIRSPEFTELECYLKLHLNSVVEKDKGYVGLSLNMPCNCKVRYRFSIIDKNEKAFNTVEGEHYFRWHWSVECIVPQFISKACLIDQKKDLLVNDTLTIVCELQLSNDYKLDCQNYEHALGLANDLQTLFENHEFSDIKLVARGKTFYAHKNILASRSSVFAAMFRHNMKENVENVVPIKDISVKVLKEMLHYMYTGSVRDMRINTAQDLLIVAEKYDIPGLKKISGQILEKKLTVKNAIDILILADSHNAIELKKNTVDFLTVNIKEVMGTKSFTNALNSHLTLIITTIETIINLRIE